MGVNVGFVAIVACGAVLAAVVAADRAAQVEARYEFNRRWGPLAAYNAERARGVPHPVAVEMWAAREQARYDEWAAAWLAETGARGRLSSFWGLGGGK